MHLILIAHKPIPYNSCPEDKRNQNNLKRSSKDSKTMWSHSCNHTMQQYYCAEPLQSTLTNSQVTILCQYIIITKIV